MNYIYMFLFLIISSQLLSYSSTQKSIEINLTNHVGDDRHAFFSSNGTKIIFESNRNKNWDIYIMNADGSDQNRLTENDYDDRMPSWHPDGKSILFQSNHSGNFQLYILKLNSGEVKLIELGAFNFEPEMARFSNDGKQIIFTAKTANENNFNLFQFNIQKQKLNQITFDSTRSVYGSFLPGDEEIIFHSRRDTENKADEIYIQNLQTSAVKRLTQWHKHNFCPSVSPNGQKVAYVTSMEGIRPELYFMEIDGKNEQRLTFNANGDTEPQWSPDGNQIVFTGYRNGNFEICLLGLKEN